MPHTKQANISWKLWHQDKALTTMPHLQHLFRTFTVACVLSGPLVLPILQFLTEPI